LAENRYKSYESLVEQGAVTRDRFNEASSEYSSAQANLSEAQQRLQQARNTNNPEIDQLAASVREAEQQLQQLRAGSRQEVITQAEAQLAQAKGQQQAITAQLGNTKIVAPASGKVAERNARVGDVTSPSQPLFKDYRQRALRTVIESSRNRFSRKFALGKASKSPLTRIAS
jgi:multidrug resistance efflux pump